MTQTEFWRRARKITSWKERGAAREVRDRYHRCPLRALAGTWSPSEAAARLQLPKQFAYAVADAADAWAAGNRLWLLEKLGVGSRPPRNPE